MGTGVCRGAEKDVFVGIKAGFPFVAWVTAGPVEGKGLLGSEVEMEATLCGGTSSAWPKSPSLGQTYLLDRLKG